MERHLCQVCQAAIQLLVISKLDYCNILLTGLPVHQLDRLQKLQNWAARLVMCARKCSHITPHLMEPHWLPVCQRVKYKVLLYVFKVLHKQTASCIADLIQVHSPCRILRSGHGGPMLLVPRSKRATAGRTFSRLAPCLWNSLPMDIEVPFQIIIGNAILLFKL